MNFDPIGVAGLGLLGRGKPARPRIPHSSLTTGADTCQRARASIATAVQELIDRATEPYIEAESLTTLCGAICHRERSASGRTGLGGVNTWLLQSYPARLSRADGFELWRSSETRDGRRYSVAVFDRL
jgi:hypothetical protein